MSATRTQIYLTAEQRRRIDAETAATGMSLAEIVRRALDAYLGDEHDAIEAAFNATFGSLRDLTVPSRSEWDRGYG